MVRLTGAALDVSWFIPIGGIASAVKLGNVTQAGGNFTFAFPTEAGRSRKALPPICKQQA